ncbi:MAG: hypothetical protein HUJ63_13720 [Enterococcus sp.]|nr:hypothetical protein [Enterococcus sp.]
MLMATARPQSTKKRILSDSGHMCNEYAGQILSKCVRSRTKEIVLAHISQEANTAPLAHNTVANVLKDNGIDHRNIRLHAVEQYEVYSGGHN